MDQFQMEFQKYTFQDSTDEDENSDINENLNKQNNTKDQPFQAALVFNKKEIPHPTDTKSFINIKGFFLLSFSYGAFPKIPKYDTDRFDSMLKNWITEHFILDHNATVELQGLSLYPTRQFFTLAPNLKPWNKKAEIFLKGVFFYWAMDDFLTKTVANAKPLLTKEHFTDLIRFITNIMTGLYRNTDAIPNLDIPYLNQALRALFSIYQELKEYVAGYEKYHIYYLKELVNWIQFHKVSALYLGTQWEPYQQPYFISRKLTGRQVLVELIQLLTATYIDDNIREHVLFKLFCESGDLIHNLVYDVFSFPRESKRKEFTRNMLVKKANILGMEFDEAVGNHLLVVNNEMIDFIKVGKALSNEFPESEPLLKYVNNLMLFVDGSIHYFANQERYGECESKVMKVVKCYNNISNNNKVLARSVSSKQ